MNNDYIEEKLKAIRKKHNLDYKIEAEGEWVDNVRIVVLLDDIRTALQEQKIQLEKEWREKIEEKTNLFKSMICQIANTDDWKHAGIYVRDEVSMGQIMSLKTAIYHLDLLTPPNQQERN